PEALLDAARTLLRQRPSRPFVQRLRAWASNLWIARQLLAPLLRKQTAAKVRKQHYPAPFALIEVWRRGGSDVRQRLKLEADSVVRLASTPTAR
ncbi:3-hydroxyacyl-CoA dehydrogenase, partial [mine drainage metagenome]